MINRERDPMGQAMYHYFHFNDTTSIKVNTNITEGEELPVSHLFRKYSEMPFLEKEALRLVKGRVLDVGAGSGAHSLYLQNNGFDVTSIDLSELSCILMNERGLKNVKCNDIWTMESETYDTIMFMMNGIGLVKNLEGLEIFLEFIKNFIAPSGQILLDSSDIKYMFYNDQGDFWVDMNSKYYGELEYQLTYKNYTADPFPWLFIDFERLRNIAIKCGWNVELIYEDDHFHYLAKLILK
ncbi:MAG: SAM-dependent methyltransferase [Bacteroidetes bacterium MED-G21]|nr:MAG: SAM-dependent methyltransferase [Bacteroidetes bacterium MED-G21]